MRGPLSRPARLGVLVPALAMTLAACDPAPDDSQPARPDDSQPTASDSPQVPLPDTATDTLRAATRAFEETLEPLLAKPDSTRLDNARAQWATLYDAFNDHYLSLAARACDGDHLDLLERSDAWPLYPAYVDALPAWPDSGIVNDPALELTAANLREQQGATTEGEVALGFQPLWLLLAGAPEAPRRPADLKPAADQEQAPEQGETVDTGERRASYLRLATDQLKRDLAPMLDDPDDQVATDALRCAIGALGQRLERLATYRDADEAENGLYLAQESSDRMAASQPTAALEQISSEEFEQARRALAEQYPGFEEALERAMEEESWGPLSSWAS